MPSRRPTRSDLADLAAETAFRNEQLSERLAELELAREDVGWTRLGGDRREFDRDFLDRIVTACRLNYLKNPLINHGVEVQRHYVFGRPVSISSRDPDVNDVVQTFLDDPSNRAEFTDETTMGLSEVELQTAGNVFFALFTALDTGRVRVRSFPFDEMREIASDPDDYRTPRLYLRRWTRYEDDDAAVPVGKPEERWYPDWRYDPDSKPPTFRGKPVDWDVRVYHVKVGGTKDMRFGVPEVYAALDWARAVKVDLEQYLTIKRALARWAQSLTVKGGAAAVATAKSRLNTSVTPADGQERNPPPVTGSTFIASEGGARMEPYRTAGAQPSPDEGRRIWLMVCAALGLPETMLTGDSDVGNYATAKTLDRPTELKMTERQTLWKGVLKDLCEYAVRASVESTSGPLAAAATVEEHPVTGAEVVVWSDELPHDVDVKFPNVLEHDPLQRIEAIVKAATLGSQGNAAGTMADRLVSRLLMAALEVEDVDEELELVYPDGDETPATGNLRPPPAPVLGHDGRPLPAAAQNGKPADGAAPAAARDRLAAALAELVVRETR